MDRERIRSVCRSISNAHEVPTWQARICRIMCREGFYLHSFIVYIRISSIVISMSYVYFYISSYLTFIFKPHPTLLHCIYPHLTHRHIHVTCLFLYPTMSLFLYRTAHFTTYIVLFTIHLCVLCLFLSHFSLSSAILR